MYHIAAYFEVPPDHHEEFIRAALEDGCASVANEPGTKRFELVRDEDIRSNRFYLNEAYDDEAAFERHKSGRYYKRFFEIVDKFVEREEKGGRGDLVKGNRIESICTYFIDAERAVEPSGGDEEHFVGGDVKMQRFGEAAVAVFFEPGARTRPHIHPTDQILHFISGTGFVAFPGADEREIGEGGVCIVPAGVLHMHGATSRSRVCHLAVKTAGETDWEPDLPSEWSRWRN
jgi:autoinducer 2-degrading protein